MTTAQQQFELAFGPTHWSEEDLMNFFGTNPNEEARPHFPYGGSYDAFEAKLPAQQEIAEMEAAIAQLRANIDAENAADAQALKEALEASTIEQEVQAQTAFWSRSDVMDLEQQMRNMQNVIRDAHRAFVEVADEATSELSTHGYKTHVWEALYTAEKLHKDARDESYAHYRAAHADLVQLLKDEGIDTADVTSERDRFHESLTYRGERPSIEDVAAQPDNLDTLRDTDGAIVASLISAREEIEGGISRKEGAIEDAKRDISTRRGDPRNVDECLQLTLKLSALEAELRVLEERRSENDLILGSMPVPVNHNQREFVC